MAQPADELVSTYPTHAGPKHFAAQVGSTTRWLAFHCAFSTGSSSSPRSPPNHQTASLAAAMRPGSPAPAMGPGTETGAKLVSHILSPAPSFAVLARKTLNPSGAGLPFSFRAIKEVEIDGCEAAHPLCNWLGERFHPQVSATRVRIPKLATGVRHAAARATAILIPPASIAIVFRPAPVGSRS